MSIPAVIGTIDSTTGHFRGRQVTYHDGPESIGPTLAALIARDGLDTTLRTLTVDHYGWSAISEHTPDLTGIRANPNAKRGTPAHKASLWRGRNAIYDVGHINIPGFGVAYTTRRPAGHPEPRVRADDWVTGTLRNSTVTKPTLMWLFLFDADEETLFVVDDADNLIAQISFDSIATLDWNLIQCGTTFERCDHYARHHMSGLPAASSRLGMLKWLGRKPLTAHDAYEAVVDGVTYPLNGSGRTRNGIWEAYISETGEYVPLYKVLPHHRTKTLSGVELLMPPTLSTPAAARAA